MTINRSQADRSSPRLTKHTELPVKAVDDNLLGSCEEMKYVIDGGMLVQRVSWKVGSTFREICMHYVSFLTKYTTATIVFDKYEHSTKDMVPKKPKHHFNCSNMALRL